MCKKIITLFKKGDRSVFWNDICKPLVLAAGKVLARVFLNRLTVCIIKVVIQTVFLYICNTHHGNNYFVSLASSPRIKVSNKTVYVVVVDIYKQIRRQGLWAQLLKYRCLNEL